MKPCYAFSQMMLDLIYVISSSWFDFYKIHYSGTAIFGPFLGQLTNFMKGFGPKITNSLTKNPEGNFWSAIKVVLLIWNSNLEWTLTFNGNGQKATSHPSCGIFFRSGAYLYSGEFTNAAILFFDKLSNNHRFSNNNDQILYTQWSKIENPIQK